MSYCATEYKEGHLLEEIHREPNNSKDDYLISQLEKLVEEVKKKFPEVGLRQAFFIKFYHGIYLFLNYVCCNI